MTPHSARGSITCTHQSFSYFLKPSCATFLSSCLPGCIPINPSLPNGRIQRNDSVDGITYAFHCDVGHHLNGSHVVSCRNGQWNGTVSSCLPVGEHRLAKLPTPQEFAVLQITDQARVCVCGEGNLNFPDWPRLDQAWLRATFLPTPCLKLALPLT